MLKEKKEIKITGHGDIVVYGKDGPRLAYIPKQIVDEFGVYVEGKNIKLSYIMDAKTVVIFDPTIDPELLLKSLDMLKEHVKLRVAK